VVVLVVAFVVVFLDDADVELVKFAVELLVVVFFTNNGATVTLV
jgi:hypothetical protein